jgi:hypothetical protein
VASVLMLVAMLVAVLAVCAAPAALAVEFVAAPDPTGSGEGQLVAVMQNLVTVLQRLLVFMATVAITVAGVRYLAAMGDMAEIDSAKRTLKAAAIGYAIAALAGALAGILRSIVGL